MAMPATICVLSRLKILVFFHYFATDIKYIECCLLIKQRLSLFLNITNNKFCALLRKFTIFAQIFAKKKQSTSNMLQNLKSKRKLLCLLFNLTIQNPMLSLDKV